MENVTGSNLPVASQQSPGFAHFYFPDRPHRFLSRVGALKAFPLLSNQANDVLSTG